MAVKIVALSCSSASTKSTSLPAFARIAARLVAIVVLPLPPLIPPQTSIIMALPPYQRSAKMALKQYEYRAILALFSRERDMRRHIIPISGILARFFLNAHSPFLSTTRPSSYEALPLYPILRY